MYTLNLLAAAAAKSLQLCPTLCDPIEGLYLKSLLFPLVRKYKGFKDFPCGSAGKESTCNGGVWASILGLGRSPGEGKVYPLQYSIVHRVANSPIPLSDFHFLFGLPRWH